MSYTTACEVDEMKKKTIIGIPHDRKPKISFKEASEKIYEIRGYKNVKKKTFYGRVNFPQILVGHKFKLQLIEKEKDTSKDVCYCDCHRKTLQGWVHCNKCKEKKLI